jgi:hypothetical protein
MSEQDLWGAVLQIAVCDLNYNTYDPSRKSGQGQIRSEAERFLLTDSVGYDAICNAAEVNPDYVRRIARKVKANPDLLMVYGSNVVRKGWKGGRILNRELWESRVAHGERSRMFVSAGIPQSMMGNIFRKSYHVSDKRQKLADILGVEHDALWVEKGDD